MLSSRRHSGPLMLLRRFIAFAALSTTALLLSCAGSAPNTSASGDLILSCNSLTLNPAYVGEVLPDEAVYITDIGKSALTGINTTLSDTTNFSFSNTNCTSTLAPLAACTNVLAFQPKSLGTFSVTVTSTANDGASASLTFTGTALADSSLQLSPSALTFPTTSPGSSSASQNVTVTQAGALTLGVAGIAIAGANASNFSAFSNCGDDNVGFPCTITVTFSPSAPSTTYNATLQVTDSTQNTFPATTVSIPLTGTSGPTVAVPQASVSPASLTFLNTIAPATVQQNVILTNGGSAPLLISAMTILGLNNAVFFTQTNNCGASLAANASCTIVVSYKALTGISNSATLYIQDNAANSPQRVTLAGSGISPAAFLYPQSLVFTNTGPNIKAPTQNASIQNQGSAALTIQSIALTGPGAAAYSFTTTCGVTLAIGASCQFAVNFDPPAIATYNAAITITSNSPNPVAFNLSDTFEQNLYVFPDPPTQLYSLVTSATKTIDLTAFQFTDATLSADLIAACNRSVKVRAILDQSQKTVNTPVYTQLNATPNCAAAWSNPQFAQTHQSTLTADASYSAIMTLLLNQTNPSTYNTTRDFLVIDNDPADVAAIETTFNADFNSTTDFSFTPPTGDKLLWAPNNEQAVLSMIAGAQHSIQIETENLTSPAIVNALIAAAQGNASQGVCGFGANVEVLVPQGSPLPQQAALDMSCVTVAGPPNPMVHGNFILVDEGFSTVGAYIGSMSLTDPSMTQSRELGILTQNSATIQELNGVFQNDAQYASVYSAPPIRIKP